MTPDDQKSAQLRQRRIRSGRVVTVSMRRSPRTRRGTAARALVAPLAAAALAAGCTGPGSGPADDGRGSSSRRPSQQPAPTEADSAPVLAVKLDNARTARPHTGLEDADVVYVEQVEGGL